MLNLLVDNVLIMQRRKSTRRIFEDAPRERDRQVLCFPVLGGQNSASQCWQLSSDARTWQDGIDAARPNSFLLEDSPDEITTARLPNQPHGRRCHLLYFVLVTGGCSTAGMATESDGGSEGCG